MPNIELTKQADLPFRLQGNGVWSIHVSVSDLTQPLPFSDTDLFTLKAEVQGGQAWQFGGTGKVKLGFDASTNARLLPLWPESAAARRKLLEEFGLEKYFDTHPNDLLLILQLGAEANANVTGKFTYSFLSASATVKAGAEGQYALIRAYPSDKAAEPMVREFFQALRLPADVQTLAAGEVIVFEYSGYLDFKAGLGAGYEISGSPAITLGQLHLAEKYDFSVAAKLSLGASMAGHFQVTVREGELPGWARVTVERSRSNSFSVAADVKVAASLEPEGLPDSADEFLSAILGLKAKNWLNLFQQVRTLTDFASLEQYLDNLAKDFIAEYTGKAFDALAAHTSFDEWLTVVNKVTDSYVNVGNHAVTLFDRYFDPITKAVDGKLLAALKQIKEATSWEQFKGQLEPTLWDVVQQLTNGDPLGWMLGDVLGLGSPVETLTEVKKQVDKVFALIRENVHQEIRDLIALAKTKFPLDHFINELNDITFPQLQAKAEKQLISFVERLLGQTMRGLSNSELGQAITRLHEALDAVEEFKKNTYDKFAEVLQQAFQFNLHAAYSREATQEALLDFEFDLSTEVGRHLLHEAGHGRFQEVLAAFNTGAVKLHKGLLTHRITRETKVSVNIAGWHTDWHYESLDRLVVESKQRLESDQGQLRVITTLDLKSERERKRNGERVATNLLLRFFGESNGKLELDEDNEQFLIDAITRLTARYDLVFNDPLTTPHELAQYLSLADDFGLTSNEEELIQRLGNQLPTDALGNFGTTTISYDVRFTLEGLKSLFKRPLTADDEAFVRSTMRVIVLANYLRKGETLARRAWCYWSKDTFRTWSAEGFASFTNVSSRTFTIDPSPFRNLQAPSSLSLPRTELIQLNTLYQIELSMLEGLRKLTQLLQTPGKLKPRDFEKALGDFGKALKLYDDFDEGENTIFALLDRLIQRVGGSKRNSSLTLTAKVGEQEVTQTLLA